MRAPRLALGDDGGAHDLLLVVGPRPRAADLADEPERTPVSPTLTVMSAIISRASSSTLSRSMCGGWEAAT